MTTTTSTDSLAFGDLVSHGVLHRRHLRVAGISDRRAAQLSGPGGPWRQVYSGVYLVHDKPPSREELLHAAVARYGRGTIITGTDALCAHGISHPRTPEIHLLVPHNRRPSNEPSVITYRTARMPKAIQIDGLPYTSAARAALDLARRENDPDEIARLVSLPLYWGLADRAELTTELNTGNQRGSAAVRTVLRNLDDQETFAHGQALRVLQRTPLPTPQWNVAVCDRRGHAARYRRRLVGRDRPCMALPHRSGPGRLQPPGVGRDRHRAVSVHPTPTPGITGGDEHRTPQRLPPRDAHAPSQSARRLQDRKCRMTRT